MQKTRTGRAPGAAAGGGQRLAAENRQCVGGERLDNRGVGKPTRAVDVGRLGRRDGGMPQLQGGQRGVTGPSRSCGCRVT